jgi:hypothetical protein
MDEKPIEHMTTDEVMDAARIGRAEAQVALRARIKIAEGNDAAATWALAIWGRADDWLIEAMAWDGVPHATAARARWQRRIEELRSALGEAPSRA